MIFFKKFQGNFHKPEIDIKYQLSAVLHYLLVREGCKVLESRLGCHAPLQLED